MINLIYLTVILGVVSSQNNKHEVRLPAFNNFSPPEEVNDYFDSGPKVQRSIDEHIVTGNPVDEEVKEVERLIQSNPELPRLTRGEIQDILDNITKQDERNLTNSITEDSIRDPKALMVVKAYTPLGSGEVNVEEFYTKPPIVSIVDSEEELVNEGLAKPTAVPVVSDTSNSPLIRRNTTKNFQEKKPTGSSTKKPNRGNILFKARASSPSLTVSTTVDYTLTRQASSTAKIPLSTRREIKRRQRPSTSTTTTTTTTTTQIPVTTYRPRRRQPPRKEIKYPNHKYPEESPSRPIYPPDGIRIVRPPVIKQSPAEINSELEDLLPQEFETQEIVMVMPSTTKRPQVLNPDPEFNSLSEPSIELEIPDHLKKVVADLNLAAVADPGNAPINSRFAQRETDEGKKAKDVLASLGAFLPSTSTTSESPNANLVADSLTPDMQNLLKSFGLLPDDNENTKTNNIPDFNPQKADTDPESYVGFKPLPEDGESNKNMEEFLAQFGLLNGRNSKSLKKGKRLLPSVDPKNVKIEKISLDAVPEDLKPLLEEMGFGFRGSRKIREQPMINVIKENVDKKMVEIDEKQHDFNTDATEYVSEEEVKKLGRLLEIMKKLEKLNGTITEDDMNEIDKQELKELISSLNRAARNKGNTVPLSEQLGPDLEEYEFGLNKKEKKRQESTEKDETVTAKSLTEEAKTPSIKDLEDSFGGASETATESLPDTTTARRSGFYYLLDWNTFFEIDDQKGKRVNLRFQPKVGDPKRFYSVNVP